ncbi:microtubule associated protein [Desarmillaria ectypa]|nr:microtubule associated protein [Desarmillaria ectypa]
MDGPPPPEEDFSALPISERLSHKNWKARVSAYESLVKIFQTTASDTDPAFKPYINNSDLLKRIATDSNAVAQEKGVECLVAFVKYAGETAAKTREVVVPALVEKCFGSSRAGTKAQALELTLQYVEVENGGVGVVADILPGLGAKQPKAVSGCVLALKEIVRTFGIQATPPPPILKNLPKIFSHSDKTVRAEGTALAQTLYQYVGPGIEPWLADLKPVQVKELKESFDSMVKNGKGKGTLKPERLTRAAARDAELAEVASGGDSADTVEEEPADMDPRAFAESVDIVPKLPPALQAGLTSSKWKERKEVLDDLSTLLSATPRIKEASELGDLAKSLATCIQKDANINCVMTAAMCMQSLAKGMMSSFARYREMVVPVMLERLKERKVTVTDSIGLALDAVFSTTTLADIIPDLGTALSSKNPQVKEGTLKFLGRSLASATSPIQPPQVKPLAETLATLLEDSFEGARNEAANCLGTLMKMIGERPLNAAVEAVADVRKAKIKEAYEKATVKCKAGCAAPPRAAPTAPPPAAAPKKRAPALKPVVVEDEPLESPPLKKPPAKPPARLLARTQGSGGPPAAAVPPPKKTLPPVAAKSAKPQTSSAPGTLDTFKFKHTPEDAEALAADAIPSSILADLADANWKTRLAALDEMSTWIDGVINDLDAEVLVRALAKKGWSEKNFQVSSKIYGVCTTLSERCPSFGRSCVALCVPHMSEKLGDMKLKKPAGDALISFAESTSLQFVLNQAYEPLSKQKAPKVLADAIGWVNVALTEFGISGLSLRNLIDFLKGALQNSNATVRTSATKTLVTVKLFAGSSIKDLLEDLNPQLLNTITAEFDKVEGQAPPDPTRTPADVASAPAASPGGGSGHVDALDDLFPRVEVDGLLKGTTILADAKSDAWKTKKEALEMFQTILDQGSNKRLKPNMGEITQVLKARVTDTNKAVQTLALDIVGRIATGMGKPFEKQCRFFVHPVTTVLSDQKVPIRTAALLTLSAIASACDGLESMVPGIHSGLETSNPMQKGTLLHWISDWFKEHPPPSSLDLSTWASSIVVSLDDRNADVRKAAQALLPSLIAFAGFDYVMQQTNSLKPASRGSAIPLIQAARSAGSPTLPTTGTSTQPSKTPKSLPKAAAPELPSSSSPPDSPGMSAPPSRAGSKISGVRRKLPQGNRPESRSETPAEPVASRALKTPSGALKRPGASSALARPPVAQALPPPTSLPLFGTNLDSRKTRCGKDSHKWVNEGGPTRKDLAELLQNQMESHATKELIGRLFSHDHNAINDHVAGLTMMCELYNSPQLGDDSVESICLANFDLPLKYASIKAHEPQPNLISKCLEIVETVLAFLRMTNQQLTDNEALCFIPTIIFKLGDAREQVRVRVQQIIQDLPKVYAYSRVFQLLLDYGLKSKVAKTRQGTLDEVGSILRKSGMGACEPSKAFPVIAAMISDKDSQVRKSALGALSEGYMLIGEKVWSFIGPLPPKDKTQLEERLRRVAGPSSHDKAEPLAPPQIARLTGLPRPGSPAANSRIAGIPRPASPATSSRYTGIPHSPATNSKIGSLPRSASPASRLARPASPVGQRPSSPSTSGLGSSTPSRLTRPPIAAPQSPTGLARPKSLLPSRLGRPRPHYNPPVITDESPADEAEEHVNGSEVPGRPVHATNSGTSPLEESSDITVTISSILSSDPSRSVDALKKVQRILSSGPDAAPFSAQYRELAEHVEGLIETITLQMAHIFERPDDLILDENFRLAKHLIQTLNNFCDHTFLAESLTIDILTSLLEELTLRLLETDDSSVKKIKDLSRFINMIILRLFATGRRMSIFRALFNLLLQVVKPFPSNGTAPDSREAKVAELVLKCVWKLARNIPQDLSEQKLDPVELFPAIEHFLQSVPPNEWRARATNKVPCGDMPLRTVKVIIQHVVAHYGDDVYDLLSASFDDPSATIVYPYVYRILNSSSRANPDAPRQNGEEPGAPRPVSMSSSRPMSPQGTGSEAASHQHSSPSHRSSPSGSSMNGNGIPPPPTEEPDPDVQLLTIIGHISSETTGALHKEGITELHHFLKAYPHKRPRVEKMLESTGAAFRKYINRALASRAAEDQERDVAVADAFDKLEANRPGTSASSRTVETSPMSPTSPQRTSTELPVNQDRLSRLHDLFHYRSSTLSNESSQGSSAPSETKQSLS